MLVCSLVHEGKTSLSLSRIQVVRALLEPFPNDMIVQACSQCADPACVAACTTGALHIDPENGKISVTSPIGQVLIGREEGDEVKARTPGGIQEFEIIEIR